MGLVLDTSIIVAAERGKFDLAGFLDAKAAGMPIHVSAITASELLHGVHRAEGARRKRRENFVEDVLDGVMILPFDGMVARTHAKLWAGLEQCGSMIGPHDLIIAATCLTFRHQVATLNTKDFERVPGLRVLETDAHRLD